MNKRNERAENINRIFRTLELQGVDTNKPLLYGYYFVDKSKEKLEKVKDGLTDKGYTFVDLELNDDEYWLHLEKEETHSRETLLKQLDEFDKLARSNRIESFDGWDVGNPDATQPLISNKMFEALLENKTPEELYNFAVELLENQIFDKSIFVFDKCVAANFECENSLYKQFICYDYMGEAENAIAKLKEVLKLNPVHFKACFNIGALSYDLEDFQTSVEYYKKAAEIDDKDDSVYYGIAASQFCLGELQASEENCKTVLKLNSKNGNAKELLKMIKDEE
ncbi:MAG: ribonuclease E inhibitor RraB [Dysgonomonas sp.]|nr:ribonuclease E inhibitor RraB [Dysgonomonas sp.]